VFAKKWIKVQWGIFSIFIFFTFQFSPVSQGAGTHRKRKTPKFGLNRVPEGRTAETVVEFSRPPEDLTPHSRFPIRVPIHYWAYLLPFWLCPPPRELYHYAIVKASVFVVFPYTQRHEQNRDFAIFEFCAILLSVDGKFHKCYTS